MTTTFLKILNVILIALFILFSIGIGLNKYSESTAKDLCRENGMQFDKVIHKNFWNVKDDAVCYQVNSITKEISYYYFRR